MKKSIILFTGITSLVFLSCDSDNATENLEQNPEPENVLFYDSFESANMLTTNADGFKWANNNRTSIVTNEAAVWNNGEINNPKPDGRDWTPKDGAHSLRFHYPAGKEWAEQRFSLGGAYPEIWFKYWLRVPTNFKHGASNPTNQKLFALWMDGYSTKGTGPTVIWNPWNDGQNGSTLTIVYKEGGAGGTGGHMQSQPWISYPEDQGRWMQIVLRAKASKGKNTNDALIETYRRWESEAEFTLIHQLKDINMPFPSTGPNGWAKGYIMGWTNPPYEQHTDWLMDQFTVSTNSLLK